MAKQGAKMALARPIKSLKQSEKQSRIVLKNLTTAKRRPVDAGTRWLVLARQGFGAHSPCATLRLPKKHKPRLPIVWNANAEKEKPKKADKKERRK